MKAFWLTVISVNWGRGYDPGVFGANVRRVLKYVDGREHVVILPQELDEEPDPAHEHKRFASMLEPGTKKVAWQHREPIVLSPGFTVERERVVLTMQSGGGLGAPKALKVGPDRFAVTCVGVFEGLRVGFGNTHPHRSMPGHPRVQAARLEGERVFAKELRSLRRSEGGTPGVWGADMNDISVPELVADEQVALDRGLDHLRFWNHPDANAEIELVDRFSLDGTIDPHDPIGARFRVSAR